MITRPMSLMLKHRFVAMDVMFCNQYEGEHFTRKGKSDIKQIPANCGGISTFGEKVLKNENKNT